MWIMTAIEFYRLTEETLNNLAKAYDIEDLEKYYQLTDIESLKETRYNELDEIGQIFAQIAFHGQNAQRIDKIVDFKNNFEFIDKVTENFNPKKFLDKYENIENIENKQKAIVEELRKGLKWNSKNSNKRPDSFAKRFAGILLCAAEYLKTFATREDVVEDLMKNYTNFTSLIDYFTDRMNVGFSVPLSCDFLKEFDDRFVLPKPDVHLKDTMAKYLKKRYKDTKKDNYQCIKDTIDVVNEINAELKKEGKQEMTVYQFDRMIYLVCSQNFFLDDKTKGIKKVYLDKIK